MIIVTGAAGFIGANLVQALNAAGEIPIAVDNLTRGEKFTNLADCEILDYLDKQDFLGAVQKGREFLDLKAIVHLGACSATTEWDGRYMMTNNYEYSKELLHYCLERRVPFLYASSASVYGAGPVFKEERHHERPLNVYGYSKFLFDQYVRRLLPGTGSQLCGLRYFNVYGPREQHKESMASVALHFDAQLRAGDTVRLFEGSDGYAAGEQRRDFVHVADTCAVKMWLLHSPAVSGIFNIGTGRAQTFNEVARAVIGWHGRGRIEYMPFPEHLQGRYQSYTQADLGTLRAAGYTDRFRPVEEGVPDYLDWLHGRV